MPTVDRIQYRRGTAAQWTAANPTLTAGEPGFETDTRLLKIGDGTTAWTALPYFNSAVGVFAYRSAAQAIPNATATIIQFDAEVYDTHAFRDDVTNPSRLTVPAGMGGKYLITGQVTMETTIGTAGVDRAPLVNLNGAEIFASPFPTTSYAGPVVTPRTLAPGDYVELGMYHDAGATKNTRVRSYPVTWLALHRIGA